jgi:glycosyltransferase involved in cell wall biosynthesis
MTVKSLSICIISSSHEPMDERIYYHFAKTLNQEGHKVSIICSTQLINSNENNITFDSFDGTNFNFKKKLKTFQEKLNVYNPDIIISQAPFTNIAAYLYKRNKNKNAKIIYDVTEWHPSISQLRNSNIVFQKAYFSISLAIFNLFSTILVNAFIFGETSKQSPYRFLFPFKKSVIVSYFPNPIYFPIPVLKSTFEEWTFGYTGILNKERGFFRFLEAISIFKNKHPEKKINLLIIGKFENKQFENDFYNLKPTLNNIEVNFYPTLSYLEFCNKISEMDLCFDLREKSWEYDNSLPIKLFYYMASGKPVIYSDLKAIRKDVEEIVDFAKLVNPEHKSEIVSVIENYILNTDFYDSQSKNASNLFLQTYNWNNISPAFIHFIENLSND